MDQATDLVVIGAGAAGMPAALFAAERGAKVILLEAADRIGGTFHLSSGQMSAAGTRIQAAKGIHDTPDLHFDDIMRISRGTANPALVRLAVDHAADTLHWLLDNGLELMPDHPIIHYGHEPYGVARTYWGPEEGRSVLKVLAPMVERAVAAGKVDLRLQTRMRALTLRADGGVVVTAQDVEGVSYDIDARAVIVTTGGYTADPALFSSLSRDKPRFGGGYDHAKGDGLAAVLAIGGTIVNQDAYLPTFAGVAEPEAHGGMTMATQTYPQFRQPWEIYVDGTGRRFVREDDPSVDRRERALLDIPDMTFWALFDDRIKREAPNFFTTAEWSQIEPRFGTLPDYVRAHSLPELAGRTHRPLPLMEAPFYAVRHRGWSIVGFAGLAVDAELRVVDAGGQPIPGIYAAGEVLGLGATAGNSFCGGMSVTPAMTFGRLLGERIGATIRGGVAA